MVHQLRQNRFVDQSARVLFIEMTFYSDATGLHTTAMFIFEFMNGAVAPMNYISTANFKEMTDSASNVWVIIFMVWISFCSSIYVIMMIKHSLALGPSQIILNCCPWLCQTNYFPWECRARDRGRFDFQLREYEYHSFDKDIQWLKPEPFREHKKKIIEGWFREKNIKFLQILPMTKEERMIFLLQKKADEARVKAEEERASYLAGGGDAYGDLPAPNADFYKFQSSEEIITDNRFDISGNEFQNRDPEIGCNDEWARRCGYLRFTVMGVMPEQLFLRQAKLTASLRKILNQEATENIDNPVFDKLE